MRQQIYQTVITMNDMLAKLSDLTGYSYQAGNAANFAAGAFNAAEAAAEAAVPAFNAAEQAAKSAANAARDAANAMRELANVNATTKVQYYDYTGKPVNENYNGQKYIGTNRGLQPVEGATGMYTGA